MSKISVYMTGGIAAYKAVMAVRGLQKAGHQVRVAMTRNAEEFVGASTLAALTKTPVLDDLFADSRRDQIAHIELADWSDLALVLPADANVLAKMANGLADDAVSTTLLACHCPKLVVPAMNEHMWKNPATQRNLALLKGDGVKVLEPASGFLAEGYSGKGRMPEPDQIVAWVQSFLTQGPLSGKKIVVTAGGNLEAIDPVRFIGNHSSGKMGCCFARAAAQMGAEVTLIYGNVSVALPQNDRIRLVKALSAKEMLQAVQAAFAQSDALIMAAAVSDWTPKTAADHKLKKQAGVDEFHLTLVKNPDILQTVAAGKRETQVVIGFAAETNDLLANAQRKLDSKGADLIIANDVSSNAFGADSDQVTLLTKGQAPESWPRMSKQEVAERVLTRLAEKI
ncbi:bifunctional phosphopantothenoylcysteine decarboxylase/phosphopantothenate--cysteine ligase CoaBC [Lactobacillus sp. 23-2]|uniref:bifunctional phosphopantothenoylcysteine decarboxylase/phosphopantothenate--cysteine ligase CoaBC n=1 Tax=Lactobacillus sp. 23-2 TaxID=2981842 RepID=UPI003832EA3A